MRKLLFAALVAGAFHVQAAELADALPEPYPMPAIERIDGWINSEPLSEENLKGKVVLIDFWAYSCVNCVRTLPHLAEWDKKYRDKGLVIIGVHAPEFDFEKKRENVERAVKKWHIPYPVALDNDMKTWGNFSNQYWPAHYLVSREGKVVYTHFGEGKYDVTENNIRLLLGMEETPIAAKAAQIDQAQTPETYLGYFRADHFASNEAMQKDTQAVYSLPESLPLHGWALQGNWKVEGEKITSVAKGASLTLHFYSKNVYLVLGTSSGKPIRASLVLDGKPMKDSVKVDAHMLYTLVKQDSPSEHTLVIKAEDAGLEAYAFTFGE